ncbi:hypothetical protein ACT9TU_16540 [Raoultella planticola]|uniref:hypothetical protein n=1 Tax=Raoultella planticola TaxID=575 RepID=UPI0040681669
MAKYRVVIEAPGLQEIFEYEADSAQEAEEIGRDMFFDICNYGVSAIEGDDQ